MESAGDVAWIVACILCGPATGKNLDEHYLAWVGEFQSIDIHHSRSDNIKFLLDLVNVRPRGIFEVHRADAYAANAPQGVDVVKGWMG
jgi:hypothetical protein